jgi:alkylated DNA repair dioxygenase AlkB
MDAPKPDILLDESFLSDAGNLFAELVVGVPWDERMRARKTASFGTAYNYSGITYDALPMLSPLIPIVDKLEASLGFRPNNCLLNFYESGESTMGFHSDSTDELMPGTGVAIVSLGAERSITFQSKQDKQIQHAYPLKSGSLLYMSAEVQHAWKHAILKQESVTGGRISLTFRQMAP